MARKKMLIRPMLLVTLFGSIVGLAYPQNASGQTVIRRTVVRRYVSSGGCSASYDPRYAPEIEAYYRAKEQWIRLQILREERWEQERQRRLERYEAVRAEQRAARAARRDRISERAETFRARDDINQQTERAQNHLATGVRFEASGDYDAAMAMYRLVIRSVPNTTAATEASRALDRLQGTEMVPVAWR